MADYNTNGSKNNIGDLSPMGAQDSSWSRLQPLITPAQLRAKHLMGLTLVSGMRSIDGKIQQIKDDDLAQTIIEAVGLAETELGMDIFPTSHNEGQPFDAHLFRSLGYFKLDHRPASSIEDLTVTASNGVDIYRVPLDWVSVEYLSRGTVSIIPINISSVGGGFAPAASSQTGGAAFFLSILGQREWINSFWRIRYTTGFQDGKLPVMINALVGTIAAMEVLSMLAATYGKTTGHSTGIDGVSQSVSGPGGQIFVTRMQELAAKRTFLVGKLKAQFGTKFLIGEV